MQESPQTVRTAALCAVFVCVIRQDLVCATPLSRPLSTRSSMSYDEFSPPARAWMMSTTARRRRIRRVGRWVRVRSPSEHPVVCSWAEAGSASPVVPVRKGSSNASFFFFWNRSRTRPSVWRPKYDKARIGQCDLREAVSPNDARGS